MIYLLFQKTGSDYDEVDTFVVRADTSEEARRLASEHPGKEGRVKWLNVDATICTPLEPHGEKGIIVRNFKAG